MTPAELRVRCLRGLTIYPPRPGRGPIGVGSPCLRWAQGHGSRVTPDDARQLFRFAGLGIASPVRDGTLVVGWQLTDVGREAANQAGVCDARLMAEDAGLTDRASHQPFASERPTKIKIVAYATTTPGRLF